MAVGENEGNERELHGEQNKNLADEAKCPAQVGCGLCRWIAEVNVCVCSHIN